MGKGFTLLMEIVPVPGGGSFIPASERSEHRWVWMGSERSSLGGDKDHERRKYRIKCTLMQTVCLYNRHSINCNEYLLYLKVPVNYPLEYIYEN